MSWSGTYSKWTFYYAEPQPAQRVHVRFKVQRGTGLKKFAGTEATQARAAMLPDANCSTDALLYITLTGHTRASFHKRPA